MSRKTQIILGIVALCTLFLGWRWISHARTEANDSEAEAPGAIVAAVARVRRGTIENNLTIAGAFKPFQDVDVHAKVAGYIRTIYVDVGDHVKEQQTLAVLEVPELAAELAGATAAVRRSEQEIHRAQGDVERAKSTHAAAHAMYDRLRQAAEQQAGLVAQQEVDNAQAKDLESEAAVSSAQAAHSEALQALEVAQANQNQFSALSNYTENRSALHGCGDGAICRYGCAPCRGHIEFPVDASRTTGRSFKIATGASNPGIDCGTNPSW